MCKYILKILGEKVYILQTTYYILGDLKMKTETEKEYKPTDIFAKWDKILDEARETSIKAEKNNQIVGRLLSYQVADGYAKYVITEELANGDFRVELLEIYDGYTSSAVEELERVLPRRLVMNHLRISG